MRHLGIGLGLCALALGFADCSSTDPSPVTDLVLVDMTTGTGAEVKVGQTVAVHYNGYFYDEKATTQLGKRFATSENGDPFQFVVGAGEVIPGWDRGVVGMKVGGLRRLVIPPSLAYGATGSGIIPSNSTLVFDIDMVEIVVDPEATPTPTPTPTPNRHATNDPRAELRTPSAWGRSSRSCAGPGHPLVRGSARRSDARRHRAWRSRRCSQGCTAVRNSSAIWP